MITNHASARVRQRGIRRDVLQTLLSCGTVSHRGGRVFFMDKAARALAMDEIGPERYGRISDKLNAYAVVSNDGHVVTVAKRLKRLKR